MTAAVFLDVALLTGVVLLVPVTVLLVRDITAEHRRHDREGD